MFRLPASGVTTLRTLPLQILALFLALPASADWLVFRDGERVQTRGPWRLESSAVVFTSVTGTLSSLRRADVDLSASERATAVARGLVRVPHPPPKKAEKRPPVLVLTNKDIGPGDESSKAESAGFAGSSSAAVGGPPLTVVDWRKVTPDGASGLEIEGTLRSESSDIVTGLGVRVSLFDAAGQLIADRDATVDAFSVAARTTIGFRVLFPGVQDFDGEPEFEPSGRELSEVVGESR